MDCVGLIRLGQSLDEGMLRCDDHVGRPKERVGPSRVNPQDVLVRLAGIAAQFSIAEPTLVLALIRFAVIAAGHTDEEVDLGAGAAADPVSLQGLDALGPVERFQIIFEPIGVGGDPQHPLSQRDSNDRMAASFADAALHFLVGQHGTEFRAPVDGGLDLVGQAVLILVSANGLLALLFDVLRDRQFGNRPAFLLLVVKPGFEQGEEDELGPAEVLDVGRSHFAFPVVAEAQHLELAAEVADILLGGDTGMGTRFFWHAVRQAGRRRPSPWGA